MKGIYQHCSERHLHRYVAEFDFRYNIRIALVDEATQKWCGAERAWNAIEWALSHDPFAGASMLESGRIRTFIFVGVASVELPDVRVIYEATKELIIVHEATFEEAKARFAGHA